jgi:DNA-binding NarL/FixJ family response regulator
MIKILIVDDQAVVRKGLKMQLSLEADLLVVGEAENGRQALEMVLTIKPDVIILDLEMPVMDGLSTLEILRKEHPGIPIIILSIHESLDDRLQAGNEGVSAFVVKSGDPSQLISEIRQVADHQII